MTIDNQAGATIKGGGTTVAAIDASNSFDRVTITNAGKVDGSSSGKAFVLSQNSNNTVTISGGAASVLGDMDGGVGGVNKLNFDIGAGNSFSYYRRDLELRRRRSHERQGELVRLDRRTCDGGRRRPIVAGRDRSGRARRVGDTTLSAGSGLVIDLDPTSAENDVLNVTGAVALNGADLVLDLLSAPTTGESFDIVTNDGLTRSR